MAESAPENAAYNPDDDPYALGVCTDNPPERDDDQPATCRHGETEPHHFTADDHPRPGLWWCAGPDGDYTDDLKVVRMVPARDEDLIFPLRPKRVQRLLGRVVRRGR